MSLIQRYLNIDLRNIECDYERFNKKIENIIKDLQEYKKLSNDKPVYISITKDVYDLKNILIFLYVYTSLVFAIIINYSISK